MKINFEMLILLCDLYKAVPLKTPKRLDIILETAKDVVINDNLSCTRYVIIDLHDEEVPFQTSPFNLSLETIARLEQNIPKLQYLTQNRLNVPWILLPTVFFCCGKMLRINTSYANIKIYSNKGLHTARSYHAKCKNCGDAFYHGFWENKNTGTRTFSNENLNILLFNSGSAFTIDILKLVDNMICV